MLRVGSAACDVRRLEDDHVVSGALQSMGGRQARRTGSDHDDAHPLLLFETPGRRAYPTAAAGTGR
jgi:hypothetical protein